MARLSLFNSPFLLGFEEFEQALERISKTAADGYPPYNVEQRGENQLRITLAVAGFRPEDLQVQVKDNQLIIQGRQGEEREREYLHRGIATRQFVRNFVLAEGMEVTGAALDNGLLQVTIERVVNAPVVRTIPIEAQTPTDAKQAKTGDQD